MCIFSLQSGLHAARWRFQIWLSLPHWSCDLCTRYRRVCRNIPSPMPVSLFQCLLLWSTFHMHTQIWTWPGNASEADGDVLVVPNDFWFGHSSNSLGYPGEYFRLGSLIRYYSSQIFKATECLRFLFVYGNVSAYAIGVIVIDWVFSALICMPYAVEAFFKVIYQFD